MNQVILVKAGIDPAIAILAGVISGAIVGALVGALIVYGRLSSLVASLGVLFLLRGLILVLTQSRSITMMDELENHWVYHVLVGNFYGFPMQMFWALAFVIFSYYLFNKHVFGIHIHHVGDNYVSAEQMGINVKAVKIKTFMFVGLGAGIAGIFTTLITYSFSQHKGLGIYY